MQHEEILVACLLLPEPLPAPAKIISYSTGKPRFAIEGKMRLVDGREFPYTFDSERKKDLPETIEREMRNATDGNMKAIFNDGRLTFVSTSYSLSSLMGKPKTPAPAPQPAATEEPAEILEDIEEEPLPVNVEPEPIAEEPAPSVPENKPMPDLRTKEGKIAAILAAYRRPCPTIVERFTLLCSDGQYRNAGGIPWGVKVVEPVERKSVGFCFQDKDGITYGTLRDSAETLRAMHEENQDKAAADFRKTLEQASPREFDAQLSHWIGWDVENEWLDEVFSRTVPNFQTAIKAIATVSARTWRAVYRHWRRYTEASFDQSPLLSEFVEIKAREWGVDPELLAQFADIDALESKMTFRPAVDLAKEQMPRPTDSPAPIASVSINPTKGGVEIRFPSKPSALVLSALKAAGFRWSRFSSCWWIRGTAAALEAACSITGTDPETRTKLANELHGANSAPDDHDMRIEDDGARVCGLI